MGASLKFHFLLCFTLILASSILCKSASDDGFTVELVHRDSPRSPYYNPVDTPYQRMANAFRRSISRVDRLNPNSVAKPDTPSSVIVSNNGEYLLNLTLGTPPVTIVGIADTGSDLIWTQCKPCTDCFKQAAPLFDPRKSSTYKDISCHSSQCGVIDQTFCDGRAGVCGYAYTYGDNTFTLGTLATETLTMGSSSGRPAIFPKTIFGCGHHNSGNFDDRLSGIIGLGGGSTSLISQMGKATGGKFSYCLVPYSDHGISSKLNFGANAVVTGSGVVSTPLIQKDTKTFYYVTLEAVSVGKTRIEFTSGNSSTSGEEGNIIVDSGTTFTLLPQDLYTKIEAAMVKSVKLPRVRDPSHFSSLCYKAKKDVRLSIPTVTFHFKGADVRLNSVNSFVRVVDNVICFTVIPTPIQMTIYGNLVQTNYLIGYDTQNMKLSFKPVDCTLH
ncbi:aspartic proteinase CDR1-like [Syzygium oleosum]|uniref:aspartic proteinase CDR1-like n=1 Tax=Syzygium oleosum TaxID=219896 RepID=UPI0024B973D4|nr:aspartic proteinase CDR1-like [Syzygium oleosum]